MPGTYYQNKIYPLQNKVLKIIEQANLDFYLTGGTALGRCYLGHRYSDDLDFFVNGHKNFKEQSSLAVSQLKKKWACDVTTASTSFLRIFIEENDVILKIDFVNDVPAHFGEIRRSKIFHRVDSWKNILSNKLCALSRSEAKDMADLVFIAKNYPFDWETIVSEAKEKDLWVDPLEICKLISQFPMDQLEHVKWIQKINLEKLKKEIQIIHDGIFSGSVNSLVNLSNYNDNFTA